MKFGKSRSAQSENRSKYKLQCSHKSIQNLIKFTKFSVEKVLIFFPLKIIKSVDFSVDVIKILTRTHHRGFDLMKTILILDPSAFILPKFMI